MKPRRRFKPFARILIWHTAGKLWSDFYKEGIWRIEANISRQQTCNQFGDEREAIEPLWLAHFKNHIVPCSVQIFRHYEQWT